MIIHVSNIAVGLDADQQSGYELAIARAGVAPDSVRNRFVVKRSVDARHRHDIRLIYTIGLELADGTQPPECVGVRQIQPMQLELSCGEQPLQHRPVVVGFGPAGLFCALYLARQGYRPLVLERGSRMEQRVAAVERYHSGGVLDENCNVQFGEGGAGTFSDGKLTTRINDPRCDAVLRDLCSAGAPSEILQNAKPHIGTDLLRQVVVSLRQELERLGGEVRFDCTVTGLLTANGRLCGLKTGDGEQLETDTVVLAMGHSARDTFAMLYELGLPLQVKPFSVGARIEHLQAEVDKALYGDSAGHPLLPKGEYQLSWRDKQGRAAYTFCMCPGGLVVPAASQQQTVVTNGMSYHSRDGVNANSALVVSVDEQDFGTNPMGAVRFQQEIERRAWAVAGDGRAPVQTVDRFLEGKGGAAFGAVRPSYCMGVAEANLDDLLPAVVTDYMRKGLRIMGQTRRGFAAAEAVLTAPETRTSSPVRLLRDRETLCCTGLVGLYPCGEGSGYAGGIMSAAVDGIQVAQQIMVLYKPFA